MHLRTNSEHSREAELTMYCWSPTQTAFSHTNTDTSSLCYHEAVRRLAVKGSNLQVTRTIAAESCMTPHESRTRLNAVSNWVSDE